MAMREFEHGCSAWVAKLFFLCQSLNLSDFLGVIWALHSTTKFDKSTFRSGRYPTTKFDKSTFRSGRCPHRPKISIKLRPSRSETLAAKPIEGFCKGSADF